MINKILKSALFILSFINCIDINSQWAKFELNDNFKHIIVCNEDTLAITSSTGVIYLSENQGKNWEDISLPAEEFISDAQFIGGSKIYATTTENLWVTSDYGIQWVAKDSIDGLAGLHFLNDTVGIIAASNNILQVNLNTGVKDTLWSMEGQEFFDFGAFQSMLFSSDSVGFALGTIAKRINGLLSLYGIIIMTNDYGKNWQTIYDADSMEFLNAGGIYIKGNRLYAFNIMNLMYVDIDNEPVWHTISLPSYPLGSYMQGITSLFFTTRDTGYIALSPIELLIPITGNGYDIVLRTIDGGETWVEQLIDTTELITTYANPSLSEIKFLNDSIGIAIGYNKLFYTGNKGGKGISNAIETVSDDELKVIQFGGKLQITFNTAPQRFDLNLYDLKGINKIRITEDKFYINNYNIDVHSLEDGLYICEIYIDKAHRFTKKIYISQR